MTSRLVPECTLAVCVRRVVGERRPSGQYNARLCTNKRRYARRSERRRGGALVGEKQMGIKGRGQGAAKLSETTHQEGRDLGSVRGGLTDQQKERQQGNGKGFGAGAMRQACSQPQGQEIFFLPQGRFLEQLRHQSNGRVVWQNAFLEEAFFTMSRLFAL